MADVLWDGASPVPTYSYVGSVHWHPEEHVYCGYLTVSEFDAYGREVGRWHGKRSGSIAEACALAALQDAHRLRSQLVFDLGD